MQIRRATVGDAERIVEIYNWYILHTIITFETDVVSPQDSTVSTTASRPTAARERCRVNLKRHIWAAAAEATRSAASLYRPERSCLI
jgi:L-amino acid N-acyltransferase YncA